jgi:hypothetical protein
VYKQYSSIADVHNLQFTVTQALGFSVFTSRTLVTEWKVSVTTRHSKHTSRVRMRVYWPAAQHWAWRGIHRKHLFCCPLQPLGTDHSKKHSLAILVWRQPRTRMFSVRCTGSVRARTTENTAPVLLAACVLRTLPGNGSMYHSMFTFYCKYFMNRKGLLLQLSCIYVCFIYYVCTTYVNWQVFSLLRIKYMMRYCSVKSPETETLFFLYVCMYLCVQLCIVTTHYL